MDALLFLPCPLCVCVCVCVCVDGWVYDTIKCRIPSSRFEDVKSTDDAAVVKAKEDIITRVWFSFLFVSSLIPSCSFHTLQLSFFFPYHLIWLTYCVLLLYLSSLYSYFTCASAWETERDSCRQNISLFLFYPVLLISYCDVLTSLFWCCSSRIHDRYHFSIYWFIDLFFDFTAFVFVHLLFIELILSRY